MAQPERRKNYSHQKRLLDRSKKDGIDLENDTKSITLTQNTTWERNTNTKNITNKSKEISPFPAGDHKAAKYEKHETQKHKWSTTETALERSVKIFYFNQFLRRQWFSSIAPVFEMGTSFKGRICSQRELFFFQNRITTFTTLNRAIRFEHRIILPTVALVSWLTVGSYGRVSGS